MLTDIAARPALGSATHGPHIFDFRQPWGGPRFHPPGEHPATWRLREQRRRVAFYQELNSTPLGAECLEYIDRQLEQFEESIDREKAWAWDILNARRDVPDPDAIHLPVHPRCLDCGYVGTRTFLPNENGVLMDVLSRGLRFEDLGYCARCESPRYVPTHEEPTNG